MNPIEATAQAIYMFEGGAHPQSRNVRNLNPGNLRPLNEFQSHDGQGYRMFDSFAAGWVALTDDIKFKVNHRLSPTQTMLDFFNIYAPQEDHNDPDGYAQFVCHWLTLALNKPINLATHIGDIYAQSTP